MQDDASLVAAYRNGDTAAFAELYNRHFTAVFGAVYMKTHHRQTAEDLVSQTWLQAVERLHTFHPAKGSFGGWIHRIARNVVIDYFRTHKQHHNVEDAWDIADDTDLPRDVDTDLRIQNLRQHLRKLPAEQRDILLLRVWYRTPFADIAEQMGLSEGACKMRYKRSLEALRNSALVLFLFLSSMFHVLS